MTNIDKIKQLIDTGNKELAKRMLLGNWRLYADIELDEFISLIGYPKHIILL